ncbi:hypothetical protein KJ636_00165 [Patescibacteria group bacterium]|nr:hypothetical protein [Patescibacteria group bacterium]MBU4481200.1 hypothetical protein [Patescibacteria group bacterium]
MFNFEKRHTTPEEIIKRKIKESYQKREERKAKKEPTKERTEEEKIEDIVGGTNEVYRKIKEQVGYNFETEFMIGNAERAMEIMYDGMKERKISEIKIGNLEKVLNEFVKTGVEKRYSASELGFIISFLAKKSVEEYVKKEKQKGKELKDINVVDVKLPTKGLKEPLHFLGYKIPEKLRLIIDSNAGNSVGEKNRGGQIIVNGNVRNGTGLKMEKGMIIVKGNAGGGTGEGMKGGKILIKGDCGERTGSEMMGGELDVVGKAEEFFLSSTFVRNITKKFSPSAFSEENKGKITYMGRKIFENGKRIQSE